VLGHCRQADLPSCQAGNPNSERRRLMKRCAAALPNATLWLLAMSDEFSPKLHPIKPHATTPSSSIKRAQAWTRTRSVSCTS
jgi:hypothetical protein